jgi:Ras family protein T1
MILSNSIFFTIVNFALLYVLMQWALMTLLDPRKSLANLTYIGYGHDPASTFSVTRKRSVDRKKQRTERNVFQCFVFGPKKSGKSALLDSFLGRKFSNSYKATMGERYAANVIDQPGVSSKSLNSYVLCHMWIWFMWFFLFCFPNCWTHFSGF